MPSEPASNERQVRPFRRFSPVKINAMKELPSPLIIVDSPAVAERLRHILGSDYEVCATDGQICDLPTEEMGIDPDTFVPKFRLTDRGRDALKRIRPLIPEAKTVYLATETSAAGESLAAQLRCV